jgi:HK97 family phage portal protein
MAISNLIHSLKNMWLGTDNSESYLDIISPYSSDKNIPFSISNAEKVAAVSNSINILSYTFGKLPLNIYTDKGEGRTVDKSDPRYPMLHYNPNGWSNHFNYMALFEYWRNYKGNSFARIYRDGSGMPTSLVHIPPSKVLKDKYAEVNGELYYTILNDKDQEEILNASELLHFRGLTKDGVWGISPLEAIRLNMSSSYSGILAIDSFYKNNAMTPRAIRSTVSGSNQKAMIEAIEEFNKKYAGAAKAGLMAALPPNTDIVDLGMSMVDQDFIAMMTYNTKTIGAIFGIPVWMLGIIEATKINTVEAMMTEFKATTISAIGRIYREEFESKLLTTKERLDGVSIEFNYDAMIETDSTTRITNQKLLQSMGVATINDICKREGYTTYPEGNKHMMPGNYLTVEGIVNKPPTQTQP